MADVPSANNTIQDIEVGEDLPINEATFTRMAASLNRRIKEKARIKIFTSSGTMTFPDDLLFTTAFVWGTGGGGGGGSGGGNGSNSIDEGGSGGNGGDGTIGRFIAVDIVAGETATCTIGAGGSGGARVGVGVNGKKGVDGGGTFFTVASGTHRFLGGTGGDGGFPYKVTPGDTAALPDAPEMNERLIARQLPAVGGRGGGGKTQVAAETGSDSHYADGGAAGPLDGGGENRAGPGGGGGAGANGNGGAGAEGDEFSNGGGQAGSNAAANTGAGGGGGAGGPGSSGTQLSGAGGNGGTGYCIVLYYAESDA